MTLFYQLTGLAVRRQITYRAATLAGLATNFFFGLLRAAVMVALYGERQQVAGMSLQDAITYTGLTQAIISFLYLFGWFEIIYSVQSGHVSADLLKPMSYFSFWMAQDLGRAFVSLALRGLPIMVFYGLAFQITIPQTPGDWLFLAASLLLAWMVSFSYRFVANLAAFWIQDAAGVARFFFALSWLLSGFIMPLRFMPDWFIKLCYLTPFPHMVNTVVEIYLGLLSGGEILRALLIQAAWIIMLVALGHRVFRRGVRKLVIQGG
jgi:ABC-2 type transport system permease protein